MENLPPELPTEIPNKISQKNLKLIISIVAAVIVLIFGGQTLRQPTKTASKTKNQEKNTARSSATADLRADEIKPDVLYPVVHVADGDTIVVEINGREITTRLIGIDTPETVDPRKAVQCFGKEASNKTKELLGQATDATDGSTAQTVRVHLETDPSQGLTDKYGRLLAYVTREDGLFINKFLLEQGYAHEYTYDIPYKYQKEFKAAAEQARVENRGLYQACR